MAYVAFFFLPAAVASSATGGFGDRELVLDVFVNGRSVGLVGDFTDANGILSATPRELQQLGLRTGKREGPSLDLPIRLNSLAGVSYFVDSLTQTIHLTASDAALEPDHLNATPPDQAGSLPIENGTGVVANYDLGVTKTSGRTVDDALVDLRGFAPWGVLESSAIATSGGGFGANGLVRLDTTFDHADPEGLTRYRAGDLITGGLDWTRPVRLGGFQATTDFSVRPDLVTFPVPTIAGRAAVPSTVDVLLDGVQLLSRDVPAGPFEVRRLPVVVGAGDVSLVVRDPSGRETTRTLAIYASRRLLSPGLEQFSVEAGSVRLGYGLASDDYRMPAASATYRRGLADWVTVEAHAEGDTGGSSLDGSLSRAGGMAGGGASFAAGRIGVFSVDAAWSRFGRRGGALTSISFERIAPILSLEASITAAGHGFSDVASAYDDPVPSLQARASLGLALGRIGSVGIAYVAQRRSIDRTAFGFAVLRDQPLPVTAPFGEADLSPTPRASLLSVSYSAEIPWVSAHAYATGFHDFASGAGTGVTVGVAFPLGSRTSVSASYNAASGQSYGGVQASKSVVAIGDVGGRVEVDGGGLAREDALVEYKSPVGLIDGEVDRTGGRLSARGDVRGSIAYVDGRPWASNTVYDSFAVVDTGAAGIAVLQENRFIGRTSSSGSLLVPDLRSFEANHLGIDPADVPADATVGPIERLVRPRDRAGVVVRFPVTASRGAILHLVDGHGVPLPVGASLIMRLPGATAVSVGYDGEAYVVGLAPHDRADVALLGGEHCTVTFDYHARSGIVPDIGPLRCLAAASRAAP